MLDDRGQGCNSLNELRKGRRMKPRYGQGVGYIYSGWMPDVKAWLSIHDRFIIFWRLHRDVWVTGKISFHLWSAFDKLLLLNAGSWITSKIRYPQTTDVGTLSLGKLIRGIGRELVSVRCSGSSTTQMYGMRGVFDSVQNVVAVDIDKWTSTLTLIFRNAVLDALSSVTSNGPCGGRLIKTHDDLNKTLVPSDPYLKNHCDHHVRRATHGRNLILEQEGMEGRVLFLFFERWKGRFKWRRSQSVPWFLFGARCRSASRKRQIEGRESEARNKTATSESSGVKET
ncbi:hypothetical protein CPB84DRAFT_1753394 [Gymnopilus junonius]|uniref:Uncharacterized protein n=1 Tax=Gymnopilus junonius TaxID=109634 RepID=A0A9P5N7V2_GYMJU|nr:hypothetical protein CPB84DRAFT_1753394 [Gymnopilus junonius]